MEAAECGAASLAMVLAYHGRHVPLETLRQVCGVSRDGTKASTLLAAARRYGLTAKGLKAEPEHLAQLPMPSIAFVDFCHFLVVEGLWRNRVQLNDPAGGRRSVTLEEFDAMFTGVVLTFKPGSEFVTGDERPSLVSAMAERTRGVRAALAFAVLASLALVLPGIAVPVMSAVFVDHILVRGVDGWLLPLIGGMALAALLRFMLVELRDWALVRAETRLAIAGTRKLLGHVLTLPLAFFGTRYAGEIASRVDLGDGLARLLTDELAQVGLNLVVAVFFFLLMLAYDPVIAVAVALLGAFNLAAIVAAARVVSDGHRKISIDAGKLAGVEVAGVRDIETYKAAGAEAALFARWSGLNANVVSARQALGGRLAPLRATAGLLALATTATVLVLGGHRVMDGAMTIGMLVALQSLAASFTQPVTALAGLGTRLQEVRSFTERIDDVERQPADPAVATGDRPIDRLPRGAISIRGLTFGYLPLAPPLIADFELELQRGQSVAFVGPSGSGKSTLGRLIAGLYTPQAGTIAFEGRPLPEWPRAALSSAVAYVDQDVVLFEGSVADNLTLWDDTLPEAQWVAAAHDARIHDDIAARPGRYESAVEEGGRNFSGGQRQRLEIARALAANPRIVIMDEATSALDTVTEAAVMANIRARGATLIVIAHRLSTIRDCDEIIVLDGGRPVERGSHDTLMALGGRYAELIET